VNPPRRILVIRLGAMGDIIHALPAAALLKRSFPAAELCWAHHAKWRDLLEGSPIVDRRIEVKRKTWAEISASLQQLRGGAPYDLTVDLQGLVQSALVAMLSGSSRIAGFHGSQAREWAATLAYRTKVKTQAAHVVDKYREIAMAVGARPGPVEFPLPPGRAEGELPPGDFVLANPFAGWTSKEWPLEYFSKLAARLRAQGLHLVLNGAPSSRQSLETVSGAQVHISGIAGLIHATRACRAVIGLDSGPLHLAAALRKPGVALFGPTDPARNGPYGDTMRVLRVPEAVTTYKREDTISPSMRAISPDEVLRNLLECLR